MRDDLPKEKWLRIRGKKHAHWGILTLDDLPKTNWKYSQLIAQLQARYRAEKRRAKTNPRNQRIF